MKKRKITAAVLAALMLAGCGKIEDEVTPAAANDNITELSAVTPVSDSETSSESGCLSSDGNEGSEAESGSMENTEEPIRDGSAGYFGTYINDSNCIITIDVDLDEEGDLYFKNPIVDRQLLYYSAERVIDQYNCIADRDKRGYFDTIGYSDLFKNKDAAMYWAIDFFDEQDDYPWDVGCMIGAVVDYSYYLVGDKLRAAFDKYPEDDNISNTNYTRDEVLAEYREIMDEAAEKATFENSEAFIDENTCFNKLLRKNGSVTNEEYFASPEKFRLEPSDDAVYIINMCNSIVDTGSSGDANVLFSVTVLDGDYAYDFAGCDLLLTKDGDHVMPFAVAVYENLYKDKSMEEIEAAKNEEIRKRWDDDDRPRTPAEAAYEGAIYLFTEGLYDGDWDDDCRTGWQKITKFGSYELSVSDEGIDISLENGDELGEGDWQIISVMNDYGYRSGTVWLRPEPDGSGDFYVTYESPDGQREEYHTEQISLFLY